MASKRQTNARYRAAVATKARFEHIIHFYSAGASAVSPMAMPTR